MNRGRAPPVSTAGKPHLEPSTTGAKCEGEAVPAAGIGLADVKKPEAFSTTGLPIEADALMPNPFAAAACEPALDRYRSLGARSCRSV